LRAYVYKIRSEGFNFGHVQFPYHPEPENDELLSSLIVRTALLHHTDPATFINLYLPEWKNALWARDIDIAADEELIKTLSEKTGIEEKTLFGLTLKAYEGYLAETITPKTRNPFIQYLKRQGRVKIGYGLRFCPECLRGDETPFFRKKWRLSFSTACIIHNCFMLDRCAACKTPLTLYRNYNDYGFPVCYKCRADFRKAEPETIDSASYGLAAIRQLYEILDSGIFRYGERYTYSFLFFRVLRHFIRITRYWGRTAGLLDHEIMAGSIAFPFVKKQKNIIDDIPLKEQYLLFSGLLNIFENYPDTFLSFCKANKLRFTELTRDMEPLPFWYEEVVSEFNQGGKKISLEEVGSVIAYLRLKNGWTCKEHVSKMMGVYLDHEKTAGLRELFIDSC
jgi:hypothetical protein